MANKWFGTDGIRGKANEFPMTADFAMKLAQAAGQMICKTRRRAAIGKDTRLSGDMLEAALAAGFTAQGIDVVRLGVLPTPAITMVTPELDVDMSVMITASHNPYEDNGIKLINAQGNKFSDEVTAELETLIEKGEFSTSRENIGRIYDDRQAVEKYKNVALSMGKGGRPLAGMKIVLDCANGCFSEIMPEVFKHFGAEVEATANCPNGLNINRDCGSTHPQAMMKKVLETGAAMGIAVDGDGDRIIVCNDKGEKIASEQVIGYLAQYLDKTGKLNGRPVVSTVLSNTGLENFIKSMGLDYYSTPIGERHVVAKMQEVNGAVGGEESGHVVLADYSRTGDALMVALMLAQAVKADGKPMSRIFPIFEMEPMAFVNPRFDSRDQVKRIVGDPSFNKLLEECRAEIAGQGRIVIHPSGTEPLIRVWVCGKDAGLVNLLNKRLVEKAESLK